MLPSKTTVFRLKILALFLALVVAGVARADPHDDAYTTEEWKEMIQAFAVSTGTNILLSPLRDPIPDVVQTLWNSPAIVKSGLLRWLNAKMTDFVVESPEDSATLDRYQAFQTCLAAYANNPNACDRLDELTRTEPSQRGWVVTKRTSTAPDCTDDILVEAGEREFWLELAVGPNRGERVTFTWSEPYYDEAGLFINLQVTSGVSPLKVRMFATFEHSGTFSRRFSSVGYMAEPHEDHMFTSPGLIPVELAGVTKVTVLLGFTTTFACTNTQIQEYEVEWMGE